jgi:hypothetical protein
LLPLLFCFIPVSKSRPTVDGRGRPGLETEPNIGGISIGS